MKKLGQIYYKILTHDSVWKDASGFFIPVLIQAVSANILKSNIKHDPLGNAGKGDRPPDSVQSKGCSTQEHGQWDSHDSHDNADDTAKLGASQSGKSTDGQHFHTEQDLAEANDLEVINGEKDYFVLMEEQ